MKKKPFPTTNELRAWIIFQKLDQVPDRDVTPETIHAWLEEFEQTAPVAMAEQLAEAYIEFKEKYRFF